MSKPGAPSTGGGPTAAAAAAAAQKQKTLLHRLDNDISTMFDNFSHLINVARVNDPPVRNAQEAFQMETRAARMVQAADSLLKLVSELKQTAIFSGFASLNENVERRIAEFDLLEENTDRLLERIGEQAAASLKELETHYYSSLQRTNSQEKLELICSFCSITGLQLQEYFIPTGVSDSTFAKDSIIYILANLMGDYKNAI